MLGEYEKYFLVLVGLTVVNRHIGSLMIMKYIVVRSYNSIIGRFCLDMRFRDAIDEIVLGGYVIGESGSV